MIRTRSLRYDPTIILRMLGGENLMRTTATVITTYPTILYAFSWLTAAATRRVLRLLVTLQWRVHSVSSVEFNFRGSHMPFHVAFQGQT